MHHKTKFNLLQPADGQLEMYFVSLRRLSVNIHLSHDQWITCAYTPRKLSVGEPRRAANGLHLSCFGSGSVTGKIGGGTETGSKCGISMLGMT